MPLSSLRNAMVLQCNQLLYTHLTYKRTLSKKKKTNKLYRIKQTDQVLMIFMGQRKNDTLTNDYILNETAADHKSTEGDSHICDFWTSLSKLNYT